VTRPLALAAAGAIPLLIAGWIIFVRYTPSNPLNARAVDTGRATSGANLATQRPGPGAANVVKPRDSPDAFQAGVTVLIYGNDPAFAAKTRAVLDRLAGLNVNTVGIAFPLFQGDWRATDVHTDPQKTPSQEYLASFIREAHRRHFTVMMRPLLDEESFHPDGKWRGTISPGDPNAWFAKYGAEIQRYARLAQTNHVEMFDVGTELMSLEADTPHWTALISAVRRDYGGQLTYSANWSQPTPGFGASLDFVGLDAFFPLNAPANADQTQLARAWQTWLAKIDKLGTSTGKPVVITELGTTSEIASYQQPWIWYHQSGVSLPAQARYYAASCAALKSRVRGMYWWDFSLDPPPKPTTDPGFIPAGKPAELEIARCFR